VTHRIDRLSSLLEILPCPTPVTWVLWIDSALHKYRYRYRTQQPQSSSFIHLLWRPPRASDPESVLLLDHVPSSPNNRDQLQRRTKMTSSLDKTGHFLARILGIKLQYRDEIPENLTRGESVFSVQSADTFVEEQPTSAEWVREILPNGHEIAVYARSLFPFTHWIGRYNLQWFIGDLVAGKFSNRPYAVRVDC
jgi:hypothetical protein